MQTFEAAVAVFTPALPLGVAFSGGADSTALLLACARRWPGQVQAIHVNHALQPAAVLFEQRCRAFCERHQVPLSVERPDARPRPGQSPEDAARHARYAALDAAAQRSAGSGAALPSVALAQHADDQVETVMLALSRGGGVAGLAAMPARWQRAGVDWYRPLLQVASADIRRWLAAQGEDWVEDPSNSDLRFARNRIRAHLLPAWDAAFPAFRDTVARSAQHAAHASELLLEVAGQDLIEVGNPPHIPRLQALSGARQANVLRHWLRQQHATTPTAGQLNALLVQLAACTTRGHRIHLKVGRGFVVRSGEYLDWYNQ